MTERSPGAARALRSPPGGGGFGSDSDEMMDADDDGGFRRGGRLRSSLPVVRSPNKSTERPLGESFPSLFDAYEVKTRDTNRFGLKTDTATGDTSSK